MLRQWRKLPRIYLSEINMSLLALIMWAVLSGSTVIEYGKQPLDMSYAAQVSTSSIQHLWYSLDDTRQLMVQRAYELWWMEFVVMIECESWFNPQARWDSWRAYGLCQMNSRRHKIPQEYLDGREYQIDYCYQKWKGWTKFYWPNRRIKGQFCKDYVLDRFIINQ